MPRIRQKADEYRGEDFRRAVKGQLGKMGLNQSDLAANIGISCSRMTELMKHPERLTAERLRKLIEYTKLPPNDVMEFLGYSAKDMREVQV